MSIGNIDSTAPGSGARFNDGKPDLSLIPCWILECYLTESPARSDPPSAFPSTRACEALKNLGSWQLSNGDPSYLMAALQCLDDPLRSAARVFTYGTRKYRAWNWLKGMPWSVPLACAARHALAIYDGEAFDPESGELHEGHLACNIIMLLQYGQTYPEGDDITWGKIAPQDNESSSEPDRPCTCHPDDNPPVPCPKQYALAEAERLLRHVDETCGCARVDIDAIAAFLRPTDSASAVQPERCCLDYPRCDCNSPPEPDDDWLCFQRPAQPKVTP